jgi:pyrroloquinoline-quinone synthase
LRRPVAGLSAIYAYEAQIPAVAFAKIGGLEQFYGITDEIGPSHSSVFIRRQMWGIRRPVLTSSHDSAPGDPESFADAIESGRRALHAPWSALDSM